MAKKAGKNGKGIIGAYVLAGCALIGAFVPDAKEEEPGPETTAAIISVVETVAPTAEARETTEVTEIVETTVATEPEEIAQETEATPKRKEFTYTLNTSSKKFHYSDCSGAAKIKDSNRDTFTGTREEAMQKGYDPCGICNP
jgi:hypothetical protein